VLRAAGVQRGAVEVIFDSADKGDPRKEGQPPLPLSYSRSIPLAKADSGDVLLAYAMNGKELPPNHGYPVRAIVPGWYGCASVKWVTRVIVTRTPFLGFDQTLDYSYWATGDDGLPRLTAIAEMEPKAQIATPVAGANLALGKEVRLFGAAWAGERAVEKVEISTDGGKTWNPSRLLDKATPYCWQRWEALWTPAVAGKVTLMARATDTQGRKQPLTHDPGRRSYMINFLQPVPVTVA
jgi:DMSO/TMAO reductase YedYZ molybdopterin-dependent catalytic subunit